ncbi:MAG: FAD-binding oxidoreductase, partial [Leptospiraceae bacterium]|nr:FAD-binding oxidoreductase [Leptospiraceae bacterium]
MRSTRHIDALANILKRGSVVTRGDGTMAEPEFLSYGSDRTREVRPEFHTLVFPADTDEVAAVVRYCVSNRLPLVPSGGRTGLSGGAVAAENEIVLSLKKLNRVLGYDPL